MDPKFPLKVPGNIRNSDPAPLPEPIFLGTSDSSGFATKSERLLQRPPTVQVNRNEGVLGHITRNKIDVDALLRMDPSGYLDPMLILRDVELFRAHITGTLPHTKRPSRFMIQHVGALEAQETMRRSRKELFYALPVFTTLKKSLELRLVQNCVALNKAFAKPPSMDLDLIHDLIDEVLRHDLIGQVDAVSYFYQYEFSEKVSEYFGVRLAGARGDYLDMVMNRMAMGWSWAPCIGQRGANVLVRGLGRAWVDNFLLLGKDARDYEEKVDVFFERAEEVNLELDRTREQVIGKKRDVALGIEFDLERKEYRMDPEWVTKAVDRVKELFRIPELTIIDVYTLAGTIVWRHHVMRHRLCNIPHLLANVGRVAKDIAHGASWDSRATLTPECLAEVRESLEQIRANEPKGPRSASEPTCEIWSDASDTHWAYLVFVGGKLAAAKQGPTKENLHIFYSELSVALGGVSEASRMGHVSATSYIDNAAAAGAMQRCASSNFRANKWLQNRMIEDVRVQWVSTTKMLADPYTRVPTGHSGPVPLPPLGITIQEAAARLAEDQARKAGEAKRSYRAKGFGARGEAQGFLHKCERERHASFSPSKIQIRYGSQTDHKSCAEPRREGIVAEGRRYGTTRCMTSKE